MPVANQNGVKRLKGLGEIAGFYDGFILDLWGVVHDGVKAFPDTINTLREMRRARRMIWLLSNAPRRLHVVQQHLAGMGVTEDMYDGILTSGEATYQALKDQYLPQWGEKCFHLGPERDRSVYEGLPLTIVKDIEEADFVLNSGIYDHFNDTAEQYVPLLEKAAEKNLPMMCANPDKVVYVGDRLVLCPGTLAEMYEKMDAQVVSFGKPYRAVYKQVIAAMGIRKAFCVGDSMQTDIAGATGAGLDSAFILSGIHKHDLGEAYPEPQVQDFLRTFPYRPTYTLSHFCW